MRGQISLSLMATPANPHGGKPCDPARFHQKRENGSHAASHTDAPCKKQKIVTQKGAKILPFAPYKKALAHSCAQMMHCKFGVTNGIRTRLNGLRGRRPNRIDDGDSAVSIKGPSRPCQACGTKAANTRYFLSKQNICLRQRRLFYR